MKLIALTAFCLTVVAGVSCSRAPSGTDLIELQRTRSGNLDVVLLSNDGSLTHDKDTFTIEFRRGDDLVDVGTVTAAATMPMAGLPEMQGSVFLKRGDVAGRYIAETDLSMSGGWQFKLEWNGPAGRGTASFAATVD